MVRREWPRLVLEILVVVAGVTISFLLNEWRISVREGRTAERMLADLHADLVADTLELTRRIGALDSMMAGMDRIRDRAVAASLPPDSLNAYMDMSLTYLAFSPQDIAYEELRQTGASRLIENRDTIAKIIGLHERTYPIAAEWDEINRHFVLERMIPYVNDEGPHVPVTSEAAVLSGLAPVFRALEGRDRFRNLLDTARLYKEGQAHVYGLTLEAIRDALRTTEP